MERNERKRSVEMFEEEEEEEELFVSFGVQMESHEEASDTEDDEEGSAPLIVACCKVLTEEVRRLLRAGADVTLCDSSQQTALHFCPPELLGKVLGWMLRPDLPPQTQLLQASWQGDLPTLNTLLADGVDVDVPNGDGVTAVMLAVRDIDLFEGMMTSLPWEYRPVEVVKELLGVSADLRVRDLCGFTAPDYAANIRSSLKEEILHMMAEAQSHIDAASIVLDTYSCQNSDSELGDSDVELDLESLSPDRWTPASPSKTLTPHHQDRSRVGEVLVSPCSPPADDLGGSSSGKDSVEDLWGTMQTKSNFEGSVVREV
ncbi:uncharacterized protein [Antennarius striatus]|uniref:uncharacterized protein n=1 Tax=Antennarius striatus TaxID=241820 RepID=UPI0035AE7B1F